MTAPRLRSVRLTYGCHEGTFELPDDALPTVIAGPNGSGKTTLLEALLRGLFGFSRRKPEERKWLESRRPWSERPARVEILIRTAEGVEILLDRDLATDEVVARRTDSDVELFRGDANPVGERSANRHFRELLGEWIGFSTLGPYRKTAWIGQGELVGTRLDDELLQAAAGTHRKVESALEELGQSFGDLTREPLTLGGRRKNRPRKLESLRDDFDALSSRLDTARTARAARHPIRDETSRTGHELERIEAEISLLEDAYRPLSERRTLLAEQGRAQDRLTAVKDALTSLAEATRIARAAGTEAEKSLAAGPYPEDFESRLGRAEVLWSRRDDVEEELGLAEGGVRGSESTVGDWWMRRPAWVGATLVAVGVVLTGIGSSGWGALVGVTGGALVATSAWRGSRRRLQREGRAHVLRLRAERADIEARLSSIESGIPGTPLSVDTLAAHRELYRRQQAARDSLLSAQSRVDDAVARASRLLPDIEVRGDAPGALDLERLLAEEEDAARTALAKAQLRLEEQPEHPELPVGIEPTVVAVHAAREERRSERDGIAEQRARLELQLRDMERASEDAYALEREQQSLRERINETEAEVEVRRQAWELVRDAYEAFRDRDQERLLTSINGHLETLSGGRLGPIETEGELSAARIRLANRSVGLESPPLSFGEKHVALMAIRLGAADFLSGNGVRHPLLVDEPFAHLDEIRAREVWELLCTVAAWRQVVITTQDRLMLRHLDVTADIDLSRDGRTVPEVAVAPADPVGDLAVPPGDGSSAPLVDKGGHGDEAAKDKGEEARQEANSQTSPPAVEQAQLELG